MEEKIEAYLWRRGGALLVEIVVVVAMTFVAEHFFSERVLVAFGAVMLVGISLRLDGQHETLASIYEQTKHK